MFTDLSLQVALVGKEVRAAAMFTDLSLQIPIASTMFTDLSLQITPYKKKSTVVLKRWVATHFWVSKTSFIVII